MRHRVAVTTTGYLGTLIDGNELKLVTEGAVFRTEDELRGSKLEVGIVEPQKVGTGRAVERWNEMVAVTGRNKMEAQTTEKKLLNREGASVAPVPPTSERLVEISNKVYEEEYDEFMGGYRQATKETTKA